MPVRSWRGAPQGSYLQPSAHPYLYTQALCTPNGNSAYAASCRSLTEGNKRELSLFDDYDMF